MSIEAWTKIATTEAELVLWEKFSRQFGFPWRNLFEGIQNSPRCTQWVEPQQSISYLVLDIFDKSKRETLEEDLNRKVLQAFQTCVSQGQQVYALNWNHQGYLWNIHAQLKTKSWDEWFIPVLPDGDYRIFLAENFEMGFLGYPWEPSICVFGQPLLDVFTQNLPLGLKRIRENGKGDCYHYTSPSISGLA